MEPEPLKESILWSPHHFCSKDFEIQRRGDAVLNSEKFIQLGILMRHETVLKEEERHSHIEAINGFHQAVFTLAILRDGNGNIRDVADE